MVEIRAEDLRFTAEEAATYLNEVMGLGLMPEDVAALEDRTERWIAALQLAALSMERRDDVRDFVARFTGNDRYIVDYLVEEVLQRLPGEIRTFLLDACILERLNGPLCDPITGRSDGKAMLAPWNGATSSSFRSTTSVVGTANSMDRGVLDRRPALHRMRVHVGDARDRAERRLCAARTGICSRDVPKHRVYASQQHSGFTVSPVAATVRSG